EHVLLVDASQGGVELAHILEGRIGIFLAKVEQQRAMQLAGARKWGNGSFAPRHHDVPPVVGHRGFELRERRSHQVGTRPPMQKPVMPKASRSMAGWCCTKSTVACTSAMISRSLRCRIVRSTPGARRW